MQQIAKFVEKLTGQHYGWLKEYFGDKMESWLKLYLDNRKPEASPYTHFYRFSPDIGTALSPLFKQAITNEGRLDYVLVPDADKRMAGWAEMQAKAALKAYASKLDSKITSIVSQKSGFEIKGNLKAHGGVIEGIITVTCADDSSFDVDTKMIINTSVLGKSFYQYPLLFRNVKMADGTKMTKASEVQMLTTFLGAAELPKGMVAKVSPQKKYEMQLALKKALEDAGFEGKWAQKGLSVSLNGKNLGMVNVTGKGSYKSLSGISETDLDAFVKALRAQAGAKAEATEIEQRLALLARDRGTTVAEIMARYESTMTGEISWPDGTVTKDVTVQKHPKLGWLIGGDVIKSTTDMGGKIFVTTNGKVYWLKGNRLVFQDNAVTEAKAKDLKVLVVHKNDQYYNAATLCAKCMRAHVKHLPKSMIYNVYNKSDVVPELKGSQDSCQACDALGAYQGENANSSSRLDPVVEMVLGIAESSDWKKTDKRGSITAESRGILYASPRFPGLYVQYHSEYYGASTAILVFDANLKQIARWAGYTLKDVKSGELDKHLEKLKGQ